ncbi:MAG: 4'-phosphopantetheinyl transferase family protein [Burkholderiales bacterium]
MRLAAKPDQVDVWRAAPRALPEIKAMLTPDELQRAARFHFEKDRRRFIAVRAWLREVLACYLDTPPADLRFDYGAHGKPTLTRRSDLRFNLSHSHDLALLAVSKSRELGVDVEFMKEAVAGPEIAARFFSAAEAAELRGLPKEQQRAAFFAGWTRKEAYIKATGAGLFGALDRFSVSLTPSDSRVSLRVHGDERETARWSLCSLDPGEGYAGALAVEGGDWRLRCLDWPQEEAAPLTPK